MIEGFGSSKRGWAVGKTTVGFGVAGTGFDAVAGGAAVARGGGGGRCWWCWTAGGGRRGGGAGLVWITQLMSKAAKGGSATALTAAKRSLRGWSVTCFVCSNTHVSTAPGGGFVKPWAGP